MKKKKKIEYEEIFKLQRGIWLPKINKAIYKFSIENPNYKIHTISVSQRAGLKLICNILWVKKDCESDIL